MKQAALKVFSLDILHEGAKFYDVSQDSMTKLAGFENLIYGGRTGEREVVLRYSHSSHRHKSQIHAELHWLSYLSDKGAAVCGPLPSVNNRLVEEIPVAEGAFFVSAFQKAQGKTIDFAISGMDTTFIHRWGQATGELHRLTRDYHVPAHIEPRKDYFEMGTNVFFDYLPDQPEIRKRVRQLADEINGFPKTKENYALCHTDLHSGNFFYDQERLWIFDFDDCAYHHLAHDLAMPLYYVSWRFPGTATDLREYAQMFFQHFLAGYLKESFLPLEEILKIPLFLRLRDCDLYGLLHHEWGSNLSDKQTSLLSKMGERLMNDEPIIHLPYAELYAKAKMTQTA